MREPKKGPHIPGQSRRDVSTHRWLGSRWYMAQKDLCFSGFIVIYILFWLINIFVFLSPNVFFEGGSISGKNRHIFPAHLISRVRDFWEITALPIITSHQSLRVSSIPPTPPPQPCMLSSFQSAIPSKIAGPRSLASLFLLLLLPHLPLGPADILKKRII